MTYFLARRRRAVELIAEPMPSLFSVAALDAPADPLAELLAAERADWVLLRLVACSAMATLVLALAGSLVG